MEDQKKLKNAKLRKEFLAGFAAGLACFGAAAFVLMLIFSL